MSHSHRRTQLARVLRRAPFIEHGVGSVVGIATGYGLDGAGIEPRWGRQDFPRLSRPALGPTQPPVQCVPGLFRDKDRSRRDADHSPPSNAVVKKEYSYTCTRPMDRTACTEPQCLHKGALYLYFTLRQHEEILF